jgi:hypothetical protein
MRYYEIKEAATPFEIWFGNSRVVDTEGKPLVVYHGTNQTFTRFSKKRGGLATGPQAGAKHGFFFTSDLEEAQQYAEGAGRKVVSNTGAFERETKRLQQTTERLEQIAQQVGSRAAWDAYEAAMAEWERFETEGIQENPLKNTQVVSAYMSLQNPLIVNFNGSMQSEEGVIEEVVAAALARGCDGAILNNINDSPLGGFVSNHYVAFSSSQIRRAK